MTARRIEEYLMNFVLHSSWYFYLCKIITRTTRHDKSVYTKNSSFQLLTFHLSTNYLDRQRLNKRTVDNIQLMVLVQLHWYSFIAVAFRKARWSKYFSYGDLQLSMVVNLNLAHSYIVSLRWVTLQSYLKGFAYWKCATPASIFLYSNIIVFDNHNYKSGTRMVKILISRCCNFISAI